MKRVGFLFMMLLAGYGFGAFLETSWLAWHGVPIQNVVAVIEPAKAETCQWIPLPPKDAYSQSQLLYVTATSGRVIGAVWPDNAPYKAWDDQRLAGEYLTVGAAKTRVEEVTKCAKSE